MIDLCEVTVTADDGRDILRDVTVTIPDGRTAVIGANGSGKTTLARLLNGLAVPSHGTVSVDGHDVTGERREVQRRVGFVFANADHQLVYPTPLEDVALGLRARGMSKEESRERARTTLASVGMEDRADQAIHTLSGGEKHLVALAAVLILEPEWIVIDEPTTTLDLVNRRRVIDVLLTLSPDLVVVTHDLELAARFDHALLVADGEVRAEGAPEAVIRDYRDLVEA